MPRRALLLCLLALIAPAAARAAPGDLDGSFGTGGVADLDMGAVNAGAWAMALDPTGRILVLHNDGDTTLAITRLLSTGAIDSSFGTGGTTTFSDPATADWLHGAGLAVQADGKIVAVGTWKHGTDTKIVVARLLSGGGLDTSYKGPAGTASGYFSLPAPAGTQDAAAGGIALDPTTGNLVIGGSTLATNRKTLTLRLTTTGAWDTTYHSTGYYVDDVAGGKDNIAGDVAVDSIGRVVFAGYTTNGSAEIDTLVGRYTKAGARDASFDGNGVAAIDDGGVDRASFVTLTPAGDILVAGTGANGTTVAVNRYHGGPTVQGASLDTSFGSAGRVLLAGPGGAALGGARIPLAVQADGDIDVAATGSGAEVIRLLPGGAVDPAFGSAVLLAGAQAQADAALLRPDGELLVGASGQTPHVRPLVLLLKTAPDPVTTAPPPPGSPPPPAPHPAPRDTTPPRVTVALAGHGLSHGAVRVRIALSEAGVVTLTAKVTVTRRGHRPRTLTFAKPLTVRFSGAGQQTPKLAATRAAKAALAHGARATLRLTAQAADVAGNRSAAQRVSAAIRSR
jgi:uncharacterized delta-60 repeat protein